MDLDLHSETKIDVHPVSLNVAIFNAINAFLYQLYVKQNIQDTILCNLSGRIFLN